MKFALFILFSLLLVFTLSYARKEPEDYWKNMMKDQPMPDAIKGLLHQDQSSLPGQGHQNRKQFNRRFDTRPIAIIYHKHVQPKDEKHAEKNIGTTGHETQTKKTTYLTNKDVGSHN